MIRIASVAYAEFLRHPDFPGPINLGLGNIRQEVQRHTVIGHTRTVCHSGQTRLIDSII